MPKLHCAVRSILGLLSVALIIGYAAHAADAPTVITLPGTKFFPESITSTKDGTLIIGSLGHGNVWRIAPGKTEAEEWIKPGTGGLNQILGVLADEKDNLLWVCSNKFDATGEATAVKTFDLKTGAPKNSYALAGAKAVCNDITISDDGIAYISDTEQAIIFMLKRGGTALEEAAKDPLLAGADGLAFGDKTTLYVNSFTTNKFVRLDIGSDGKAFGNMSGLQVQFFENALNNPDQLRQRVAFALSEIWVVSKDSTIGYANAFPFLLNTFQEDAFGNYSKLMKDVTLNPAMGQFLDMVNNHKARGVSCLARITAVN